MSLVKLLELVGTNYMRIKNISQALVVGWTLEKERQGQMELLIDLDFNWGIKYLITSFCSKRYKLIKKSNRDNPNSNIFEIFYGMMHYYKFILIGWWIVLIKNLDLLILSICVFSSLLL